MKKKLKIEISPEALKDIPEDEREEVRKEIEERMGEFATAEDLLAVSEELKRIGAGVHECPECGGGLEGGPVFAIDENDTEQIFWCQECGREFIGEPWN